MPTIVNTHAQAIGHAVRAELARKGKPIRSLESVLGIGRTAIYARTRGTVAFDYVELQGVADYLAIPMTQILASAELGLVAA